MTLAPDANSPGLWRAGDGGAGGVHALVIGISDYPNLDDGTGARAADTAGMGQLEVSAKTAAQVFSWLQGAGRAAGAPVSTCRLALAPRDMMPKDPALPRETERQAIEALIGTHYTDGRFETLRKQVMDWAGDLTRGAKDAQNVAFLFFSGHGLEHVSSPCMLAQDILDPNASHLKPNAVAFNSLWQSVRTFGVDSAFFFIDACRNAPELAKRQNLLGQDVLQPAVDAAEAPETVVWLQATRMGSFAYQTEGAQATLFGQALMEALDGPPPEHRPYDRSVTPGRLVFRDLESHIKQRVRELIAQFSATKIQPVEPGGNPYNGDALVAEKIFGPPPAAPEPKIALDDPFAEAGFPTGGATSVPEEELESAPDDFAELLRARSFSVASPFRVVNPARVASMRTAQRSAIALPGGDLQNFDLMHEFLRHEDVTWPWIENLQILDCATGDHLAPEIVSIVGGRSEEAGDAMTAWIDVLVEPQEGSAVWLQASRASGKGALAVALPRDSVSPIPVRLDLQWDRQGGAGWTLQAMSARIGEPSALSQERAPAAWRDLWDVQRVELLSDCARAGAHAERVTVLESALNAKQASPIAAAAAASTLLRAGALDALHDWPRNLADWFAWLPDGPILWAETLWQREQAARRRSRGTSRDRRSAAPFDPELLDEMQRRFVAAAEIGPPRLAPVLAMAARQAAFWRGLPADRMPAVMPAARLNEACRLIERTAGQLLSGGLFPSFQAAEATDDHVLDAADLRRLIAGEQPHALGHTEIKETQAEPEPQFLTASAAD